MKLKSIVAGLIFATSMFAVVGASQANCCPTTCNTCPVPGFTGLGWHMVPCGAPYPTARTWQQYTSGGYAPPVVGVGRGFF